MKKIIVYLGVMAAAAIAFTGCVKSEIATPETVVKEGIPFEFTASSLKTRTINDMEATYWATGDAVNLFHQECGVEDAEYVSDGQFTTDVASEDEAYEAKFTGTLAEGFDKTKTYNWYAFYPYTKQMTTPANTSAGYVYIGSRSDQSQTQEGNNSMAHIAGKNYPIAGVAQKISGDEKLSVSMYHLTSLLKVKVTNGTDSPITVSEVSFSE